ncbi:MAG TPA: type II toxin-antitoxin system Phd/YefM family antitoxin [Thermoanaerobacterium sp.]|nr:type II toxin-antitoxin system Phd/YefM family antitoxin [Thermoanaerobacterium sp.]
MMINTENMVSITEANQNFSKVARLVDKNGVVVILKNNVPKYVITEFKEYKDEQIAKNEDIESIAIRLIAKHRSAFEELAK